MHFLLETWIRSVLLFHHGNNQEEEGGRTKLRTLQTPTTARTALPPQTQEGMTAWRMDLRLMVTCPVINSTRGREQQEAMDCWETSWALTFKVKTCLEN